MGACHSAGFWKFQTACHIEFDRKTFLSSHTEAQVIMSDLQCGNMQTCKHVAHAKLARKSQGPQPLMLRQPLQRLSDLHIQRAKDGQTV